MCRLNCNYYITVETFLTQKLCFVAFNLILCYDVAVPKHLDCAVHLPPLDPSHFMACMSSRKSYTPLLSHLNYEFGLLQLYDHHSISNYVETKVIVSYLKVVAVNNMTTTLAKQSNYVERGKVLIFQC